MQYSDCQVREMLNLGESGLKRIREILKQRGLLEERERLNEEKLLLVRKIVEKQRQTNIAYVNAVAKVLREAEILREQVRRENLLSMFQTNDESYSVDTFVELLGHHFENADEIRDEFFNSFATITDILRNIGDESSIDMLNNIQGLIINNASFKFLYQQRVIGEN